MKVSTDHRANLSAEPMGSTILEDRAAFRRPGPACESGVRELEYPVSRWTASGTTYGGSAGAAGRAMSQVSRHRVDVKEVGEHIWLVTFTEYDLGYFDDETCRLEPIDNPFGPKLLPMSPE